jgi:hypothetical protein
MAALISPFSLIAAGNAANTQVEAIRPASNVGINNVFMGAFSLVF